MKPVDFERDAVNKPFIVWTDYGDCEGWCPEGFDTLAEAEAAMSQTYAFACITPGSIKNNADDPWTRSLA